MPKLNRSFKYRKKPSNHKPTNNEVPIIYTIANLNNRKVVNRRNFFKESGSIVAALAISQTNFGCGGGGGTGGSTEQNTEKSVWRMFDLPASHEGDTGPMSFNSDGSILCTGGTDNNLKLWNSRNANLILRINTLDSSNNDSEKINLVAFSPDGLKLASSSRILGPFDRKKIWDSINGNLLMEFTDNYAIDFMKWSADGQEILFAGEWIINIFDTLNGNLITSITNDKQIGAVDLSPNGNLIISGDRKYYSSDTTKLILWDASSGSHIKTFEENNSDYICTTFSSNGNTLLSIDNHEILKNWDSLTGNLIMSFDNNDAERILSSGWIFAKFSPAGDKIAIVYDWDRHGKIMFKIIDSNNGSLISEALIDAGDGLPSTMIGANIDGCNLQENWDTLAVAVNQADKGLIQLWNIKNINEIDLNCLLIDSNIPRAESYQYSVKCGNDIPSWFPTPCSCDCVCTCQSVPSCPTHSYYCTCNLVCVCVPVCTCNLV
jgi:WD40 repeat protein